MRPLTCFIAGVALSLCCASTASAAPLATLVGVEAGEADASTSVVRTAIFLSALAILPAIFISMTSFLRIVIVLSMIRHAFSMPETPPNQVIVSLALLLSLFVMGPTLKTIHGDALNPFLAGEIGVEAALDRASDPLRDFMLGQVRDEDIADIYAIAGTPLPERAEDVDLLMLTPAFMLSELRIAFTIGFIVLLPFLLIDLVVASVLLALGMMMVPPATISLPIKVLMFVLIDGWGLVVEGVLKGFAA